MELSNLHNPISTKLYSIDCKYINIISDLDLTSNYTINNFITLNDNYDANKILNFSSKISIYSEKRIKISDFKVKNNFAPKHNLTTKVVVENNTLQHLNKPNKAIANYEFLLNRVTTKDLLKTNGEIIIKKGININYKTIEKARDNGKLLELTHYSQ